MSKAIVLIGAAGDEVVDDVAARLRSVAVDHEVVCCGTPEEIRDVARRRVAEDVVLAAVGGDGTLNLVVSGALAGRPDGVTWVPTVASVPAGTVNLAANVMGTGDAEAAVAALRRGAARRLDVIRDGDGVAVLNATSGFDAAVVDDADHHSGAVLGRLHFVLQGVRRMWRTRPTRVRVAVDGVVLHDGPATSVLVLNVAQRGGADFEIVPGAAPDDGRLDVAVVTCTTIRRAAVVVWRLWRGRAVDPADLRVGGGAEVLVEWRRPVMTQRDGDAVGCRTRVVHRVDPRAIALVVGDTPTR